MALIQLFVFILALLAAVARAQDLEPRSYTNLPVGQTFVVVGGLYSEGDLTPTPNSPLQEAELEIQAAVVGAAHTFALGGKSAKIDMAVSRQCYEGSGVFQGDFVEGRRCGYGDPRLRLSWNFYGAPALKLSEFMKWEPGLVIGTSLQVVVPTGSYKERYLINFGANRWMVRPGIGLSYKVGRWHYDVIASVRFFEDNNEFFQGRKVEQDPLYSVQGHLVYTLGRGSWISLNANYYRGGRTQVDGVKVDNEQNNSRFGLTYSKPITAHHSLKLYANTGVVNAIGNDFDTYGIAWQYRF